MSRLVKRSIKSAMIRKRGAQSESRFVNVSNRKYSPKLGDGYMGKWIQMMTM